MAKTVTATMRAVAVTPMRAGSARQVELPIPTATGDTALMRVLEVGIDGLPHRLDHTERLVTDDQEIGTPRRLAIEAAVDLRVGTVSGFTAGDLVVSTVRRPDDCPNCRAGESDMCLFGR